ncbi:MAG: hypothetical protein OXO50_21220 [Caldilineaceae bacterium]|nr:hypothetical protein [Caldilineaceae bacterium]
MSSQIESRDGAEFELERMQRKHSTLQTGIQELRDQLTISRRWMWIWLVAFSILLIVEIDRLGKWIAS